MEKRDSHALTKQMQSLDLSEIETKILNKQKFIKVAIQRVSLLINQEPPKKTILGVS